MNSFLVVFDRYLRLNPLLPRLSWLRNLLRAPYHRLMNINSAGFPLEIGGKLSVLLPAEFCAKELEHYEVETVTAIYEWLTNNEGALFVDIGCSYGFFSCGVLFNDPNAKVIAIDADAPSLKVTLSVCSLAPKVGQRLELYRTLIGKDSSEMNFTVEQIKERTGKALQKLSFKSISNKTNYVNIDTEISENELPRISLDSFLLGRLSEADARCLIKCDVEGAEQIVLEGATKLLANYKPTLLLSVHPQYLPRFGGSVDKIRSILEEYGYNIKVIGIDHEEHWLCSK